MKIQYLSKNNEGRDFVCGDLHGSFSLLEDQLELVTFNPRLDRLFCVGDIIDRGSGSSEALYYLNENWFYSIRGNHEQMLLDWCIEPIAGFRNEAFRFHMHNGGTWIADYLGVHIQQLADDILLDAPITERYPALTHWVDLMQKLPFAIEIKSRQKKIGLVHAEIPDSVKWPSLEAELNKTSVLYSLLYSRKYIRSPKQKKYRIAGIDEIYCGHTIVDTPQKIGNIHYIDTGAYSKQNLTLIELDN